MSEDIETRLRLARFELPEPTPEAEENVLHAALAELPAPVQREAAPRRRLAAFLSAALARPRRRQLALLAASVLPSIALGAALGVLLWPGPSGAVASLSHPGPIFTPAAGWTTVATGASEAEAGYAPAAWATNVPLSSDPGPFGVFFFGGSELADLPSEGILIVAWLGAPDLVPAPPNPFYPDRDLPLQLSNAEIRRNWEGQPSPDTPEYLLNARVNEQWVDVRVFFGTQHPSSAQLGEADEQLKRLQIPGQP